MRNRLNLKITLVALVALASMVFASGCSRSTARGVATALMLTAAVADTALTIAAETSRYEGRRYRRHRCVCEREACDARPYYEIYPPACCCD